MRSLADALKRLPAGFTSRGTEYRFTTLGGVRFHAKHYPRSGIAFVNAVVLDGRPATYQENMLCPYKPHAKFVIEADWTVRAEDRKKSNALERNEKTVDYWEPYANIFTHYLGGL